MSFEVLAEQPTLLREGHFVRFLGPWGTARENKFFRVDRAYVIPFTFSRIVSSGDTQDLDFRRVEGSDPLGTNNIPLLPTNPQTLYELIFGFKGHMLVWGRYAGDYLLGLEEPALQPDVADADERYIGPYTEADTPFESPRLREYTVKDQEPPLLRLYNDMTTAEKLVVGVTINRCKLTEVQALAPSSEDYKRTRLIKHQSLFSWGTL